MAPAPTQLYSSITETSIQHKESVSKMGKQIVLLTQAYSRTGQESLGVNHGNVGNSISETGNSNAKVRSRKDPGALGD